MNTVNKMCNDEFIGNFSVKDGERCTYVSRLKYGLHSDFRIVSVVHTMKFRSEFTHKLKEAGFLIYDTRYVNGLGALHAVLFSEQGDYMRVFISVGQPETMESSAIHMAGDEKIIQDFEQWLTIHHSRTGSILKTVVAGDKPDTIRYQTTRLRLQTNEEALQCFYPWLSVSLEEYFQRFRESPETVLVLIGPPGTGKTTFLRSMVKFFNTTVHMAYDRDVVESPKVIRNYQDDTDAEILLYEDLDTQLGRRDQGNVLMSTILNVTNGVIRDNKKKITFSTNLDSINKVDPALLRVGRCFDIMKFRDLTQAEAQVVRDELKLPPKDLTEKSNWSLSEAISSVSSVAQTVNRFARGPGFN